MVLLQQSFAFFGLRSIHLTFIFESLDGFVLLSLISLFALTPIVQFLNGLFQVPVLGLQVSDSLLVRLDKVS